MEIIKTPEERFSSIVDFPYQGHFLEVADGLHMHYLDEGSSESEIILCLHGEPSWSYLYRKMIPTFLENGYRVIAPDLIGFGKSEKLRNKSDYTYTSHEDWLTKLVTSLDLKRAHLFCQDWGGLLGLRIAMKHPDRFLSITAANTFLPAGRNQPPDAFVMWREFSQNHPDFQAGKVIQMGTVTKLEDNVMAAYDAPFPNEEYKAGSRIFPMLVPFDADDPEVLENQRIWELLKKWEKPFLTLFSDSDPIMKGGERVFQKLVPGCNGQPHAIIEQAGHFLQEDKGEEVAQKMVAFLQKISMDV